MNETFYNITILILVIILFLAYVIIAYFYSSYNTYKEDVDNNFEKTKDYINSSISTLDTNFKTSIKEINNNSNTINDINTRINRIDLKYKDDYDELKKTISLEKTPNTTKICDNEIIKNCIDLNISSNGFNIYPSTSTNNINNLNIYNKNKDKIIAKVEMNNNQIYIGGDGENAGLYIKDDNVYMKKLNLISTNYSSPKILYDKSRISQTNNFNTYPLVFNDFIDIKELSGTYVLTYKKLSIPNFFDLALNFKSSKDIPTGSTISINIPEISITSTDFTISSSFTSIPSFISNIRFEKNNLILNNSTTIKANTNIYINFNTSRLILIDAYGNVGVIYNNFNYPL